MSSRRDVKVVLAPTGGESIPAALGDVPGIELVLPEADEVAAALSEAPVLVSFMWKEAFLGPALRWVQAISAGTEQFPVARLEEAGVVLTSAVGVHGPQAAEHALALLLAMTRGVGAATLQRPTRDWEWPEVHEIGGLTMAVIGLGAIGEAVAVRAKALGMHVIGTKRTVAGYRGHAERVYPADQTADVLRQADVAVIALPGAAATHHLIGARELEALGEGWLVNIGRGSVVDEDALVGALVNGRLRGAGLDVFAVEPLPSDSPLWDLPNVVMTPHIAGSSPYYAERFVEVFVANLAAYRGERPWLNRVC